MRPWLLTLILSAIGWLLSFAGCGFGDLRPRGSFMGLLLFDLGND
jgi:hypothetical protein